MKIYESVTKTRLMRRVPAIVRVDGKAFHTLTRGMDRPWDMKFAQCMLRTAAALLDHAQGSRLAYVQSDEISILLVDYMRNESEAWFDAQVQKIASVSASVATAAFGTVFREKFPDIRADALFDARVFTVPQHEAVNYFIWRQQDAIRNSIQSLGHAHFSHAQLQGLSCDQIQEKLWQDLRINWSEEPGWFKNGTAVYYQGREKKYASDVVFTADRHFINQHVYLPEQTESKDLVEVES